MPPQTRRRGLGYCPRRVPIQPIELSHLLAAVASGSSGLSFAFVDHRSNCGAAPTAGILRVANNEEHGIIRRTLPSPQNGEVRTQSGRRLSQDQVWRRGLIHEHAYQPLTAAGRASMIHDAILHFPDCLPSMTSSENKALILLNQGLFRFIDPGPLHAPIHKFSIRRSDQLTLILETEAPPDAE